MSKMTQAQTDYEVVKGWRDCAVAARETTMVAFYERLLAALRGAPHTNPNPFHPPQDDMPVAITFAEYRDLITESVDLKRECARLRDLFRGAAPSPDPKEPK